MTPKGATSTSVHFKKKVPSVANWFGCSLTSWYGDNSPSYLLKLQARGLSKGFSNKGYWEKRSLGCLHSTCAHVPPLQTCKFLSRSLFWYLPITCLPISEQISSILGWSHFLSLPTAELHLAALCILKDAWVADWIDQQGISDHAVSGCTDFAVAHLQLSRWKVEPVFDDNDISVDTRKEIRMPQATSKETNEMSWCLNLLSSSAHVCVCAPTRCKFQGCTFATWLSQLVMIYHGTEICGYLKSLVVSVNWLQNTVTKQHAILFCNFMLL